MDVLDVDYLRAPFPYFGGKATIANVVWRALGDVKHYLEPFFGSGAVLLSRPSYDPTRHSETVCDKDGFVANVWRAFPGGTGTANCVAEAKRLGIPVREVAP